VDFRVTLLFGLLVAITPSQSKNRPAQEDLFMVRRSALTVEELGARVLPSATPLLPDVQSGQAELVAALQPAFPPLAGHGAGNFAADAVQSGAGIDYHLHGEGYVAGMGHVRFSGSAHAVGFVQNGHAAGTLTLTNKRGSVTLELTGPDQPGFSALPDHFSYSVTGGTGAYANRSDNGELTLQLAAKGGAHAPRGVFVLSLEQQGQAGAALDGVIAGHLTSERPIPDVGTHYSLTGAGSLAGMGDVSLAGSLQTPGLVMVPVGSITSPGPTGSLQTTGVADQARATGELTLTGAHGSVTLDLLGPLQGDFAPLPGHFHFTVHSGTGDYAQLQTAGTVTLSTDLGSGTFTLALLAA
jgi:hypothetical protein